MKLDNQASITLKRGKEQIKTTIKMEVARQIEIFLANSKTRIARNAQKQRNYTSTLIQFLFS